MRNDKIKINITYNLALKHKGTLKIICNIESHTNNRTRRKIKKKQNIGTKNRKGCPTHE